MAASPARDAASRAYQSLKACIDGEDALRALADPRQRKELEDYANRADQDDDPGRVEDLDAWLAYSLAAADRFDEDCAGRRALLHDGSIYEVARRAAVLGDLDAAACYLAAPWPMPAARRRDPAQRALFRESARRMISSGLAAGDWRFIVPAIEGAIGPDRAGGPEDLVGDAPPGPTWLRTLAPRSDEALYEVYRLAEMGTTAQPKLYAHMAERLLERSTLSPAQRAAAERRAETRFREAFGGQRGFDPYALPACMRLSRN